MLKAGCLALASTGLNQGAQALRFARAGAPQSQRQAHVRPRPFPCTIAEGHGTADTRPICMELILHQSQPRPLPRFVRVHSRPGLPHARGRVRTRPSAHMLGAC
eukprot:2143351-Pleurochrysis_carterae.AAC.1